MIEAGGPENARAERAFLDANVIRGQQTTDVLLSLAAEGVYEPRWTQKVIDEMRRNRPPGLPEADIDRRIRTMNKAFPDAMVEEPPRELQDQMQADPKDQHVLAGAVHSQSAVLVTDNLKDFSPPTSGPNAMRVENLNRHDGGWAGASRVRSKAEQCGSARAARELADAGSGSARVRAARRVRRGGSAGFTAGSVDDSRGAQGRRVDGGREGEGRRAGDLSRGSHGTRLTNSHLWRRRVNCCLW
ncbi:PIN domain-containing protein [Kribbella sp. GL6]|uniref:PIN domain-containing protein n=1 Tax=Kribbella sp. GL6 TaxID=3419765 RepID=UPI003D037FC3